MSSREDAAPPSLQTLFKRVPSMRGRMRRGSLGQSSGTLALHSAVAKGKTHLAKFILDAVEDQSLVNAQDAHGKTPLIKATKIKDEEVRNKVVDLLLGYDANVNLLDHVGRSALSYACELHCTGVIRKLVMNNVDPNAADHNGNTPLMYCAMTNNAEAISIISRSFRRLGLEADKVNADAMTPLMEAAKNGFAECAKLLARDAKASVVARDVVRNMNAADWAREGGCTIPEFDTLLKKRQPSVDPTSNAAFHERSKKSSAANGSLTSTSTAETHADAMSVDGRWSEHSSPSVSRASAPASFLTFERRNAKEHPASMEELYCRSNKVALENRSLGMSAGRSSFTDVQRAGMQQRAVQEPQFPPLSMDVQDKPVVRGKGNNPATPRGGLYTKKPQPPPAIPIRSRSAAAHRPKIEHRQPTHPSTSVEDLLLMGDATKPPNGSSQMQPRSNSMTQLMCDRPDGIATTSPGLIKRGIGSDTHIYLTILSLRGPPGRHRTSSHPLPITDHGFTSDRLESASCTHLPPITRKHDQ